ncbi:hypothetical protein [Tessaracoccus palaemonis]|uniref:YCII-related domain-containing protein n=1 Tax=Tessaracoccus palaemonis TaxID=2829499 RepID=A0ABX8SIT1_9ACTN|nr:hypothetical protein [Tessaracoccus palaemonis]QXT62874.1 hypothetical protein KDB89_14290 [Tessaracoccus palaemonis]
MSRYLAIFHGAGREVEKAEVTAEQSASFLVDWARWAQDHEPAIVDNGAPLLRKTRLTSEDDEDFTDTKVAFTVVEASSHADAVRIFLDHPHLALMTGNWIEVLECAPVPR